MTRTLYHVTDKPGLEGLIKDQKPNGFLFAWGDLALALNWADMGDKKEIVQVKVKDPSFYRIHGNYGYWYVRNPEQVIEITRI